jgi:exopolysaccharide biosynthesis polyprenyl glycosylphosphotransferase
MSFAVETFDAGHQLGGRAAGLVPNMAAVGLALDRAEGAIGTLINADLIAPGADALADALQWRYSLAQYAVGRWWLNLRVKRRRLRALCVANRHACVKRALDVAASLTLLALLSPLFLLIAVLVWLEDGGPVFFAQTRVGLHGQEFKMYKVRSMCRDAEQRQRELLQRNHHKEGVTFKIKNDPRITRIGKWLRKLSLDELPQLYNVLLGDMSLVGPRPPVPREVALYLPEDRRRLAARPGITCLWQISGRSEIDFSGQVLLDVKYIESRSLWLDLKILLKTIPAVISGRGAC